MPDWRIALVQNNISFRRHQRLFHRIVDDIEFIPPSINDMEVHILRTISVSIIYVQPRITPCMGLRRQQAAEERPVPVRVRRNPPPTPSHAPTTSASANKANATTPRSCASPAGDATYCPACSRTAPSTNPRPNDRPPRATTRNREKATRSPPGTGTGKRHAEPPNRLDNYIGTPRPHPTAGGRRRYSISAPRARSLPRKSA